MEALEDAHEEIESIEDQADAELSRTRRRPPRRAGPSRTWPWRLRRRRRRPVRVPAAHARFMARIGSPHVSSPLLPPFNNMLPLLLHLHAR